MLFVACGPIRRADFETASPRAKLASADVVLDVGRRYGVVASGIPVAVRASPDPAAAQVAQLTFTQIVATTGEASGAEGKPWRRIENGGWTPREGLLVFKSLGEAFNLVVELRVFSGPGLRRPGGPAPPRPLVPSPGSPPTAAAGSAATPTASATRTVAPTATSTRVPTATPRGTGVPTVPEYSYAVTIRASARLYDRAGGAPLRRAPLEPGSALAVIEEVTAPDGARYLRTDENTWVQSQAVRVFATLPEMVEAAYKATMDGLAPGVTVDPSVQPALWLIHREPDFRYLADTIGQNKVPIRVGSLADPLMIANYSFGDRSITVSDRYADGDVRVLAVAVAHEATHAWEAGQGLRLVSAADCFEAELRAFRNQSLLWERFYGPTGKDKPATDAEKEQNEVLRLVKQDPEGLKARLVARYGGQCGYHGPLPSILATPTPGAAIAGTPRRGGPGSPPGKMGANPAGTPGAALSGQSAAPTPPATGAARPMAAAKPAPTAAPPVTTP